MKNQTKEVKCNCGYELGHGLTCPMYVPSPNPMSNEVSECKMAEKNPMWKGDKVGYGALHTWVRARFPMPKFCNDCKEVPPMDLANKGTYDRDLKNWEWLCRKCHMTKDGRNEKLKKLSTDKKYLVPINCLWCGNTFTPKKITKKNCSGKCAGYTRWKLHRETYMKRPKPLQGKYGYFISNKKDYEKQK